MIFTPSRITKGGSLLVTEATRFCTLIAAWLGSVPKLNTNCILASPSLPASEVMYFIPGTPFKALSNGIITDLIINSPFDPG